MTMTCVVLVVPKYADHLRRCQSVELSVDDLRTGRGVVLGRAVPMLRSVETQPLTGGFVLMAGRTPPRHIDDQIRELASASCVTHTAANAHVLHGIGF